MNAIWQALAREAGIAASHLAIGVTAIGQANYAEEAYYSQAFFALSIGLERTAKLALVVDYALENNGQFPPERTIRTYGHNLKDLLEELNKIAERRQLRIKLPNSEIHKAIIEILTEFSSNITRYYNLDFVTGASRVSNVQNPTKSWFEQVTVPILEVHYKPRSQSKVNENAKLISNFFGSHAMVQHHSEQGNPLNTLYDASVHTGKTEFAKPYTRMYVMQITRFLSKLMSELTFASYKAQISSIPHLSEFFAIFNNDDDYFRKRKTWSIYRP